MFISFALYFLGTFQNLNHNSELSVTETSIWIRLGHKNVPDKNWNESAASSKLLAFKFFDDENMIFYHNSEAHSVADDQGYCHIQWSCYNYLLGIWLSAVSPNLKY